MDSEVIILFAVPLAAFCVALFLTYWFGKDRNSMGLISLGLLWAGFTGVMFFGLDQATGWDGLGYLAGLLGISAPVGVGYLLGGSVGWLKSEKAVHA
jgi:hypothetical protein